MIAPQGYDSNPLTNRFGYEARPTTCRYCHASVLLVDDKVIYGRSYGGKIYLCSRPLCLARVGCHKGTDQALGTLARDELRELRKQCHAEFDLLWQSGRMRRKQAYRWMQRVLGLTTGEAHIGCLDEAHSRWLLDTLRELVQAEQRPARACQGCAGCPDCQGIKSDLPIGEMP